MDRRPALFRSWICMAVSVFRNDDLNARQALYREEGVIDMPSSMNRGRSWWRWPCACSAAIAGEHARPGRAPTRRRR